MVTFLSGGTGTPKLLWGAEGTFPREETTVVANTGDDVDLGGLHVSPDCDTVLFERAGMLDRETWWGIAEDSTVTHDAVRGLVEGSEIDDEATYLPPSSQTAGRRLSRHRRFAGVPEFMTIGDRDRAHHMVRTRLLREGQTLTAVTRTLADAHDLAIELLPMSDDPVATIVHTPDGPLHFQEYWVGRGGEPTVDDVEFRGADAAAPTAAVRDALADPVVIGPANPVTSLGPMLAIPGVVDALEATSVIAVSPFVEDQVFSGPAARLMAGTGREPSTQGVANALPFVDAFVLDTADGTDLDRPTVTTNTQIESRADSARVAAACADALGEVS